VLLGASLAQWLIRARLLAQAWFGITLIAVVLSAFFIAALLFVPAVKSDYSPLIIISSATAITAVVGVMAIGWRIREEEFDDLRDIRRIPLSYVPSIQDFRLGGGQFALLLLVFAAIILAPLLTAERIAQVFDLLGGRIEYAIAAGIALVFLIAMLIRTLAVPRAVFILLLGLPLALMGAWALMRNEMVILAVSATCLAVITIAVAIRNRVNWTLARVAIAAPLIALVMAAALRDVPTKAGLGVQDWSWFYGPDKQITELEKVLGEGRRLPVERLMSWADLRFGRTGGYEEPRQLMLRDMNFHVLRSRATLANAQCGLSAELTAAPYNIGKAVEWLGDGISKGVGDFLPGRSTTGGHATMHAFDAERSGAAALRSRGAERFRRHLHCHPSRQCRRDAADGAAGLFHLPRHRALSETAGQAIARSGRNGRGPGAGLHRAGRGHAVFDAMDPGLVECLRPAAGDGAADDMAFGGNKPPPLHGNTGGAGASRGDSPCGNESTRVNYSYTATTPGLMTIRV
jgi:hypothetical protein